jgi:hypothetical protein
MMKKILIFILVFWVIPSANATVIDAVTDGVGSLGHAGTSLDPLEIGETIEIKIVLNADPNPTWYYGGGYTGYDGYWLLSMDIGLQVSGPGTLSETGTIPGKSPGHHPDIWIPEPIADNGIPQILCASAGDGIQGPADLVWNMSIYCAGSGNITIDLGYNTQGEYTEGPLSWLDPIHIQMIDDGELGDLVLYVPEPTTIALLGLGGLFLRRRNQD